MRSLAENDLPRAAERFREADGKLGYWAAELASFKLFNRLRVLQALERGEQAAAVRRQIEAVNPRLIADYRIPDLERLDTTAELSADRSR